MAEFLSFWWENTAHSRGGVETAAAISALRTAKVMTIFGPYLPNNSSA